MGRVQLTGSEYTSLFHVLDTMIHDAQQYLIRANVRVRADYEAHEFLCKIETAYT